MRRLTKSAKPQALVNNEARWTSEFPSAQTNSAAATRYQHKDIRDALNAECSGKCAYCEGVVDHVSFTHIEHILPKSKKPDLVVAWENLTLACPRCNIHKGEYMDSSDPLLNPYEDDVESELLFNLATPVPVSSAATTTVRVLQLDRPGLVFQRYRLIASIMELLRSAKIDQVAASRQRTLGLILAHLSNHAEYISAVRAFLQHEFAAWPHADDLALIRSSGLAP